MGTGKRAFRSASPLFFPPAEVLLQPANRHTVRKTNWSFVPRVAEAKRNKALYKEVQTDTRRRWPTHTGGFDLYISRSQLPQPFPKRVYVQVFAGECDVDAVQLVEFLSRFEAKKELLQIPTGQRCNRSRVHFPRHIWKAKGTTAMHIGDLVGRRGVAPWAPQVVLRPYPSASSAEEQPYDR